MTAPTTLVTPDTIRCESDLSMYQTLLKHPEVVKVNEALQKSQEKGPTGLRRRLLATSVKLTEVMAPSVHRIARECIEALAVKLPLELFVFPSPQFNAMCFKPEDDRLFVMFSSSLLESFSEAELKFVMGHELGHHVYQHHDIPIGYILNGNVPPNPRLALDLFAWSRYAEISADRAGAFCAQDPNAVAHSLFKLASGLTGELVQFKLDDFLNQVDEMEDADSPEKHSTPKEDWFSTHPFSPLRVKALQFFHRSKFCENGEMPTEDMEVAVQGLMSLMEPSYLEANSENAIRMHRLLYAGALTVANASDGISEKEIVAFEKFFGKHEFKKNIDLKKIAASLDKRIDAVNENASTAQKMQVLNDLCVMSKASGHVTEAERAVLDRIADGLEISRRFICQQLDSDTELD